MEMEESFAGSHPDFLEEISPEDVSEKWALALNLSSSAVCVMTRCSMYMIFSSFTMFPQA